MIPQNEVEIKGFAMRAQEWLDRGFSVFPIIPGDKKPLVNWTEFQTRRATTEEVITWEFEFPDANLGIVCGGISGGLVVIDFDSAKPKDFLDDLGTLIVKTPREGGFHFYFRSDLPFRNGVNKIVKGIDVRAEGGYIVAPESVLDITKIDPDKRHLYDPDNLKYVLMNDKPIAKLPEKLEKLLAAEIHPKKLPVLSVDDVVCEGGRNDLLFRKASAYRGKGIPPEEILAAIMGLNTTSCNPPLDVKEVRTIVESACRYEPNEDVVFNDNDKKEDNGWRVPKGWVIKDSGIYRVYMTEDKNGDMTAEEARVCSKVILPVEIFENYGDQLKTKVQLSINGSKELIRDFATIRDKTAMRELCNGQTGITSENAKKMVNFFDDFLSENNLKTNIYSNQMGWHGKEFLPYSEKILFRTSGEHDYIQKGTLVSWINEVGHFMRYKYPEGRAMLCAQLVPPLLELIGARNWWYHVVSMTGKGKTGTGYAGASVWGKPGKLNLSLSGTVNALEQMISVNKDVPTVLDELQSIKDSEKKFLESLVYNLGTGETKKRCDIKGDLRETKTMRSVVISTGEESLSSYFTNDGANNRLLEIRMKTELSEETIKGFYRIKNYGHVAPLFIKYVKENEEAVREKHDEYRKYLEQVTCKKAQLLDKMAQLMTVDFFMGMWVYGLSEAQAIEETLKFYAILLDVTPNADEHDLTLKLVEGASSWLRQNINKFYGNSHGFECNDGSIPEVYGYQERDEVFYVLPGKYAEMAKYLECKPEKLSDYLFKAGMKTEKGSRSTTLTNRTKIRFHVVTLPRV